MHYRAFYIGGGELCFIEPGPENNEERGNSIPRKVGTYQEVKANLTVSHQNTFRKDGCSMSQMKG